MKNKKAFTLIELLVVVLIIGVLSAVALPQYQFAVEKARLTEAIQNMAILQQAVDLYRMEHGKKLDISFSDHNVLDIDLMSSGKCNGHGFCSSKNFYYYAFCNTDSFYNGCVVGYVRKTPDDMYDVIYITGESDEKYKMEAWSHKIGQWDKTCSAYSPDSTGGNICKYLRTYGYEPYNYSGGGGGSESGYGSEYYSYF